MDGVGRLRRVGLREVWKHEAHDFTQWLEQNLDVLNEVVDLTLVAVQRERKTESAFSVDLVAEDENGAAVVIENQLAKSDHDHLGKLITYLASTSAQAAIWLTADPRPEHVSAMSWLNESGTARFYLLKIEAVAIGNSPPAPLLTVIVKPSEELTSLVSDRREEAERYRLRRAWWSRLVKRPDASLHSHIAPSNVGWIGATSGVPGLSLNYHLRRDMSGAELYIDRGKGAGKLNRLIFDRLHGSRAEIEARFGGALSWEALEAKRACRIRAAVEGGYLTDEAEWDAIQARQVDAMNRLYAALRPHLESLDLDALDAAQEEVEEADAEFAA